MGILQSTSINPNLDNDLLTDDPRVAVGLEGEAIVGRVAPLHCCEDRVKECLVEATRFACRAWSRQKAIVLGAVRDAADDVVGGNVVCGKADRFWHYNPVGRVATVASSWGDSWVLIEPKAGHANIMKCLYHEQSHVGILIELYSRTLYSNVVAVSADGLTNALSGRLVPDEVGNERVPSVRPVDKARVDGRINEKRSCLRGG